jgi:hypothetical protein
MFDVQVNISINQLKDKISAIKSFREVFGTGLKESKEIVELLQKTSFLGKDFYMTSSQLGNLTASLFLRKNNNFHLKLTGIIPRTPGVIDLRKHD